MSEKSAQAVSEEHDRKNSKTSPNLSDGAIAEYKSIFDRFDTDGNGAVSISELNNILGALNIKLSEVCSQKNSLRTGEY